MRAYPEINRLLLKVGLPLAVGVLAVNADPSHAQAEQNQNQVEWHDTGGNLNPGLVQNLGALVVEDCATPASSELLQCPEPDKSYALDEIAATATGAIANVKMTIASHAPHAHHHMHHHSEHPYVSATPLPQLLKKIGGCESNGSRTAPIYYRAANHHSTASGGFQFLDSTWNHFDGYDRAMQAPPRVQNAYAERTLRESGTSPWVSSEPCWG